MPAQQGGAPRASTPVDSSSPSFLAFFALFQRATQAQQRGYMHMAKATFDSALALDSMYAPALFNRGAIRIELADSAGGIRDLQRAAELGWHQARSQLAFMERLREEQRRAPSRPALPADLAVRDDDFMQMYQRASIAWNEKKLARARATYDSLLRRDPSFGIAHYNRGQINVELGDTAAGMRDIRRASELGENSAQRYLANRAALGRQDSNGVDSRTVGEQGNRVSAASLREQGLQWLSSARAMATSKLAIGLAAAFVAIVCLLALWLRLTPELEVDDFQMDRGEKQVWGGAPRHVLLFRAADVPTVVFALVWCSFIGRMMTEAFDDAWGNFRWIAALFFIPFVVVGVYLLVARFFVDARRRKLTTYALTTRRAIVKHGARTESFALETLGNTSLVEHRDGTGTIAIAPREWSPEDFAAALAAHKSRSLTEQIGLALSRSQSASTRRRDRGQRPEQVLFEHIHDAAQVHAMLREQAAAADPEVDMHHRLRADPAERSAATEQS